MAKRQPFGGGVDRAGTYEKAFPHAHTGDLFIVQNDARGG